MFLFLFFRTGLAALAMASVIAFPATVLAASAELQPKLQKIADQYLAEHAKEEGFTAVSLSVSLDGASPNLNAVAGRMSADAEAAPVTSATLFQIGSITKSMTATVVLQLVKEGVLSLDAPIGAWLPEYPEWKDKTLRHLLTMTSGIPTYDDTDAFMKAFAANGIGRYFSTAQLVSFVDPALSGSPPPTRGYDYSNTNFILVQMIIERATGKPFEDHVTSRILTGHGLTDTYYRATHYPDAVASRLVPGYLFALAPEQKPMEPMLGKDVSRSDMSWAQGAGGAVATPGDVTRWARLLFTGNILDEAQRKELGSIVSMKTGAPIADVTKDDPKGFGLGVMKSMFGPGQYIWAYEGGTMGNRVLYAYFPKHGLVIAAGLNSSTSTVDKISLMIRDAYVAATGDTAILGETHVQPAQ
ncbi:serine hydrolase domain-containing protein [Aestuariivirga sp.]|uniref:serine hydrolase domain-containing protein n=1 Tax=Aestuariivirga sp. TaxID=2650926 RepID=UPI003593CE62